MRRLNFLLLIFLGVSAFAVSPILVLENQLVRSPAAADSAAPSLTAAPDGTVYLAWIEGSAPSHRTLHLARFDPSQKTWRSLSTPPSGEELARDTPMLAANNHGALMLGWYELTPTPPRHGSVIALVSLSTDRGVTWKKPRPLTTESTNNEYASLAALPDGRFLAVWLDGRDRRETGMQALRSRVLLSDEPDVLVDARVCDCCAIGLAAFPDGSASAIFRDRSDDEIRDISTARFRHGSWTPSQRLSREEWKINGCPMNGPALSSNGTRVTAAWYSAPRGKAAVYVSTSATAGAPFLLPVRVDDGTPLGHVAVVQLRDGTAFVSWVERGHDSLDTAIWLRRVTADGTLSVPVRLAVIGEHKLTGTPRLTLLKDADSSTAQLLLAYTLVEGEVPHVSTRLISVSPPEPDRNPCAICPPDETRGSPVHGHIRSVDTSAGTAKVSHDEIPGLMPAMTTQFHVAREKLRELKPGAEIFGRMERRQNGWWLFSIQTMPGNASSSVR